MKKIITLIMVGLMVFSSIVAFADVNANVPVPTLYIGEMDTVKPMLISNDVETITNRSEEEKYTISKENDKFTITIIENPSTGYQWNYKVADKTLIKVIKDEFSSSTSGLIGSPGKRIITFEVKEGSNTEINFNYSRSWEKAAIDSFILNVKSTNNLLNITNLAKDSESKSISKIYYNNELVASDLNVVREKNISYLPLRNVFEKMGYTVKWNSENHSISISKGARWTEIYIDKNYYSKNKMAPIKLSHAPIIKNGLTLVPVEFLSVIFEMQVSLKNKNYYISNNNVVSHMGYVKDISVDSRGNTNITISTKKDSREMMDQIIIHTNGDSTIFNKSFKKGDFIKAICPPVMTMSIPAQTSSYIIY
ncbi:stalk domain-containing protein [Helicovermis profundi]|uniref:Uncharacterized protein n=1 Tax=Helicovermis profundi TaxID=3065157 RepID=A0AAU9E6C6_9FIRM|nr:hypothetical protein HLPR_23540 [Clostridia bacterium S502]